MRMLNIALSGGAPRPDGSEVTAREWFMLCDAQFRNQQHWHALFGTFDYVLAPPSSTTAFLHDTAPMKDRMTEINGQEYPFGQQLAWAGLATFPGLPSTVLPIGDVGGLPVGLQVIADRYRDHATIDAARQIANLLLG
jgi:amidase